MLFLSGCQLCSKCFYTLPRAIKEKKKKEKGVGHSGVEKEKGEVGQVGFLGERGRERGRDCFEGESVTESLYRQGRVLIFDWRV